MPVNLILDTDAGPDVDDLIAHGFVHGLVNEGEVNLLATICSISHDKSPGMLDAVNTWHGRGDIPVGTFKGNVSGGDFDGGPLFPNGGGNGESDGDDWSGPIYDNYDRTTYGLASAVPDAVDVYRQALADAADGSVTIVTIGMLTTASRLLDSPGDGIDARTGSQLIADKVEKLVVMGTRFNEGFAEFNMRKAPVDASNVADNWPTEIWWQPFEIGSTIYTGKWSGSQYAGHIVRYGMEQFNVSGVSSGSGRQSWDAMAVLAAVRDWTTRFTRERGTMAINSSTGNRTWTASGSGPHYRFNKVLADSVYETEIESLIFNPQVSTPIEPPQTTTSEWTAWSSATTDTEPVGDLLPSEWTSWSTTTTATPEQTEWWVSSGGSWVPARMYFTWTAP